MSGAITAAVGGAVVGGYISSKGAKDAAQTSADAQGRSLDWQKELYGDMLSMYAPYIDMGEASLNQLWDRYQIETNPEDYILQSNIPEFDFNLENWKDPGYDFRVAEGEQALNRNLASYGKLMSGERLNRLLDYGQDMASQEFGAAYDRYKTAYGADVAKEASEYGRSIDDFLRAYGIETDEYNRLAALTDYGFNAVGGAGGTGTTIGTNIATTMGDIGASQAAGQLGSSSAWANAISDVGYTLGREKPWQTTPPPRTVVTDPINWSYTGDYAGL